MKCNNFKFQNLNYNSILNNNNDFIIEYLLIKKIILIKSFKIKLEIEIIRNLYYLK